VFDRIEHNHEEIVLVRIKHALARFMPGTTFMTAREAMSDLYRTITPEAAENWLRESRLPGTVESEARDPWES